MEIAGKNEYPTGSVGYTVLEACLRGRMSSDEAGLSKPLQRCVDEPCIMPQGGFNLQDLARRHSHDKHSRHYRKAHQLGGLPVYTTFLW